MRINELRINGFKSFANKTSIKFDNNFVGIVGPNGSGKSNIIDAIRWVFGEQSSKSMRGDSSADVIFGGTQTKKRMNQAEVTLVLDNKDQYLPLDYNEVMITRRLFRTGESEYLINNVKCRLKDITDLIMDSGMGKNSFSIISQGKIEEIVMSNPDARRNVIEDVAGILKYKKRKETALRKIEKTDKNIEQVDLLLSEMNNRLVPLERHRETALKYIALKKDLEEYEISLLANRIEQNRLDYDALKEILKDKNNQEENLSIKLKNLDNEEYIINEKIIGQNSEYNSLNSELETEKNILNKTESQYLILQERKNFNSTNDSDRVAVELSKTLVEKNRILQEVTKQRIEVKEEYSISYNKFSETEEQIRKLRATRFNLSEKIDSKKQQKSNDNISYAAKSILDNFSNAKMVKQLFTTELKYSTAIGISLGFRVNEIILDTTQDVKQAVKYLNEKKAGRATFIPLDNIKQHKVDEKLKSIITKNSGFIDFAINVVNFDTKYASAFNNLLSTTIIVDNIDNANIIAKSIYNRYRIITLDGEVVSTSGTITGGKTKQVNPLMLQSEIEGLEQELEKINHTYKQLTNSIQEFENEYHEIRTKKDRIEQRFNDITDEIKNIEFEYKDIKPTSDQDDLTIENELEKYRLTVNTLISKREELGRKIAQLNDEKDTISFNIRDINEQIKSLNKSNSDDQNRYVRLEISLEEDLEVLNSEYSISFDMALNRAKRNIDIKEYDDIVKKIKRDIKSLGIVNVDAINEYDEIKQRYDFINEQREDSIDAKNKLLEIISNLDDIVVVQFEDTYKKLRDEFRSIFTELFGGGYADLVLTNEEDMLHTGVEIVAQPPGKKLQTISLLSGGEKALTAISLLFAILRVRTVPFAILDEVEAALDEANVKRYAKYLSIFSESTQFLVITHRQGTMEIVDELYGVTMIEKGISSIVNIKLDEYEENNV